MLQIFSGNVPFHDVQNDVTVALKVIQGKRPLRPVQCENDAVWGIIEDCWKEKPTDRPTAKDVVGIMVSKKVGVMIKYHESLTKAPVITRE